MGFLKKIAKWGKKAAKGVGTAIVGASPFGLLMGGTMLASSIYKFATAGDEYKKLLRAANQRGESLMDLANRANQIALQEAMGADLQASLLHGQAGMAAAAAERARKIAAENAAAIREEGDLTKERKRGEHKATEATTRARLAAQGRDIHTGSAKVFRGALRRENKAEITFIEKSIQNQMRNSLNQGEFIAQEAKAGAAQFAAGAAEAAAMANNIRAQGQQGIASARAEYQNLLSQVRGSKAGKWDRWFDLATGIGRAGLAFI